MGLVAGAVAPAVVEVLLVVGNKLTQLVGIDAIKGQYLGRRYFTQEFLTELSNKIADSEREHRAELVVAVERKFPNHLESTRDRALEVYGRLRVWDTPLNTGLLLYLSLERQAIEIVADRGIQVADEKWVEVSVLLANYFKNKQFREGLHAAVDQIEAILKAVCPYDNQDDNGENLLPNDPVLL